MNNNNGLPAEGAPAHEPAAQPSASTAAESPIEPRSQHQSKVAALEKQRGDCLVVPAIVSWLETQLQAHVTTEAREKEEELRERERKIAEQRKRIIELQEWRLSQSRLIVTLRGVVQRQKLKSEELAAQYTSEIAQLKNQLQQQEISHSETVANLTAANDQLRRSRAVRSPELPHRREVLILMQQRIMELAEGRGTLKAKIAGMEKAAARDHMIGEQRLKDIKKLQRAQAKLKSDHSAQIRALKLKNSKELAKTRATAAAHCRDSCEKLERTVQTLDTDNTKLRQTIGEQSTRMLELESELLAAKLNKTSRALRNKIAQVSLGRADKKLAEELEGIAAKMEQLAVRKAELAAALGDKFHRSASESTIASDWIDFPGQQSEDL